MKFGDTFAVRFLLVKPAAVAVAGLMALGLGAPGTTGALGVTGGVAAAEPAAQDTVTKLNELSREAEQLGKNLQAAQVDLDNKMRLLAEADRRYDEAVAALDAANAQLATHQGAVDKVAAAVYMGGRTSGASAILTAASPKSLIDDLTTQRVVATEMARQMGGFRAAKQEALATAAAMGQSAAEAEAAAEQAATVRSDLQNKRTQLRTQVALVRASYAMLPHSQQGGVAGPSPAVAAALGLAPPMPLVGMNGLVPNARALVQYIVASYPGVESIGGVRSDPLPDHPSGRAIDVMIGSNMSLGDAINADIQARAGEFGVSYTMWRVANHFNHVHITVN